MPRFSTLGFASPNDADETRTALSSLGVSSPSSFSSLVPSTAMTKTPPPHSASTMASKAGLSKNLLCLSTDGRSVHSLVPNHSLGVFCIVSQSLPLQDTTEPEPATDTLAENLQDASWTVETPLPEPVDSALRIDAPLELICVDDHTFQHTNTDSNQDTTRRLPWLCVYTRKYAFLLKVGYQPDSKQGQVLQLHHLLPHHRHSTTLDIIRIRPAPLQQHFAGWSPPGSLAILTHDTQTFEYALHLHHGTPNNDTNTTTSQQHYTTPLVATLEQVHVENERIVDFTFAQAQNLSLLASMAVLLLKANGNILAASPLLFDGTVVPRYNYQQALDLLQAQQDAHDTLPPQKRQCAAAKQYLIDAFACNDTTSNFVTAHVLSCTDENKTPPQRTQRLPPSKTSLLWPLQLQGPLLVTNDEQLPTEHAKTLQARPLLEDLIGIVVGRTQAVDYALLSPATILPRFALEQDSDRFQLDDALKGTATTVHRTTLHETLQTLICDPLVDSLIHVTTPTGVLVLSNTVLQVHARRILGAASAEESRVTSWASLEASQLQGAVVTGDAQLGHVLMALLANGNTVPVNLTESRYVHQLDSRPPTHVTPTHNTSALQPPMAQMVHPLMEQVQAGLCQLAKYGGEHTRLQHADLEALAVAIRVKDRCDQHIVLPLLELSKLCQARRRLLEEQLQRQQAQLQQLQDTLQEWKQRMHESSHTLQQTQDNFKTLSQRSAAVLQASHDFLPNLTHAEYQYFSQLKRLSKSCDEWERAFRMLQTEVLTITPRPLDGRACAKDQVDNYNALLQAQEANLQKAQTRLKQTQARVRSYKESYGWMDATED